MSQPIDPIYRMDSKDMRNALLCGLAVAVAVALTLPISESTFNDDWSYSFTVRHLLETGRLTYNGWASATIIAQAYWGLLWVKVFGFSYTVLRLSTLPLAAAAISLCYLLGRRVGLRPRFAVFAALMVGVSPLYLPVAASFMTDAPGLFFIFLSIYLLARSMESPKIGIAIAWLFAGFIAGLIGGTDRQIVWVVPLALVPYAAWLRRDNLAFIFFALFCWFFTIGFAYLALRWFAHQPYSIPEKPISSDLKKALHNPAHFLLSILAILLTTIWVLLPGLWGIVRNWTMNRAIVAFALLIGPVMLLVIMRHQFAIAPWMPNTLSFHGVLGGSELHGQRPTTLPKAVRILVAVVVLAIACVIFADLILHLTRPLTAGRKTIQFLFFPDRGNALLPALFLFAVAYTVLLMPRCADDMVYDRYVIPLMPCVLFPVFLSYQKTGDRKVPVIGWVLFAIFTIYGIGITQELIALGRARAAAANRLIAAGVPRTQIDAGFEYNYETQIMTTGYINDPRIQTPKHAFKKNLSPVYALRAKYRLEFAPLIDSAETKFGSIRYTTFLYPFHRAVYIDRFVDPWWLDPIRAATHPADIRHQTMTGPDLPDDSNSK